MHVPKTVAIALVATLTVALSIRSIGRHYLFPSQQIPVVVPPSSVEHWALRASDGETVHVLVVPGGKRGCVVVHFHNNRETMVESLWLARGLAARGLDVVLAEYRGYGLSKAGTAPTEEGLYLDAEATLNELARRGYGAKRVILWGTSLGTGVAAEMARRHRGAGLVLISPYTSIPDLVRERSGVSLPGLLLPDRFDIASKAPAIHIPTLIIHGDADEVVPFSMGTRLARLIVGSTLVQVKAGKHGNLFANGGKPLIDRISSFADSFQSS